MYSALRQRGRLALVQHECLGGKITVGIVLRYDGWLGERGTPRMLKGTI